MTIGGRMQRCALAGTMLVALGGTASAQTGGQPMREQATSPSRSASGAARSNAARVPSSAPYNNQVKKLTNPLNANGK